MSMAQAGAAPTCLLDLPGAVLERILAAASYGGVCRYLRHARLACARLRAAADAAAREVSVIAWDSLELLPRLGGLARMDVFCRGGNLGQEAGSPADNAALMGALAAHIVE